MYLLQDFIDNAYYNCLCKKKIFKFKIVKIVLKINYITRKLSEVVILSIKKSMSVKPKHNSLIN
jgi:hypothetical protein